MSMYGAHFIFISSSFQKDIFIPQKSRCFLKSFFDSSTFAVVVFSNVYDEIAVFSKAAVDTLPYGINNDIFVMSSLSFFPHLKETDDKNATQGHIHIVVGSTKCANRAVLQNLSAHITCLQISLLRLGIRTQPIT